MTTQDEEARARELLADAFAAEGLNDQADWVRSNGGGHPHGCGYSASLAAIRAALKPLAEEVTITPTQQDQEDLRHMAQAFDSSAADFEDRLGKDNLVAQKERRSAGLFRLAANALDLHWAAKEVFEQGKAVAALKPDPVAGEVAGERAALVADYGPVDAMWGGLHPPYVIRHSPAHNGPGRYAESWLLDAVVSGRGLTTFPTKEQAEARAAEIFGPPPRVIFTISLLPDRVRLHVKAVEGTDPAEALTAAIRALEAELAALAACPAHSHQQPPAGGDAFEALALELATEWCDRDNEDSAHCGPYGDSKPEEYLDDAREHIRRCASVAQQPPAGGDAGQLLRAYVKRDPANIAGGKGGSVVQPFRDDAEMLQVLDRLAHHAPARDGALREAAAVCLQQQQDFLSPEYATDQPLSSFQERFACGQCADAILALVGSDAVAGVNSMFRLEWIGAPRPPVHPDPMTGKREFYTFDDAVQFMARQASDAEFVSLVEVKSAKVDRSADMLAALATNPTLSGEGGGE